MSVPEARMIQIQPWEKSMLKAIEKAILVSDIGINPTNDGTSVRLIFPELTEERRKELVKDVKIVRSMPSLPFRKKKALDTNALSLSVFIPQK